MKQPEGRGHRQNGEGEHTLCVRVEGMTCPACERRVRQSLLSIDGVVQADVSFATGVVRISSSKRITQDDVRHTLAGTGYHLAGEGGTKSISYIAAGVVFALYFILKGVGLLSRFSFFPRAGEGATLVALLGVGFLTSFHCVAMCGAINLGQSNMAAKAGHSPLLTNLAYQVGRLASYTSIGAVVGLLGSVIALSSSVQGVIMILAGVVMAVCALNLFGVGATLRRLTPRLPSPVTRLLEGGLAGKGCFALGVLNGLMPCGPLQSMQLYALSTGSALRGAASMFVFCLGTVPLLFAVGFATARMSRRFSHVMMRASAAAILLMALLTAGRGLALAGFARPFCGAGAPQVSATSNTVREESTPRGRGSTAGSSDQQGVQQAGGSSGGTARSVQRVASTASFRGFEPITVVRGLPVEWTLSVPQGQLTGCNAALVIPEYRIKTRLSEGDNLITFTPQNTGTFVFSCWMGMITSYISVVDA